MENKNILNKLYILHIFNDGYYASIALFMPFVAASLNFKLDVVGNLNAIGTLLEVLLAIPFTMIGLRFGAYKLLICMLLIYAFGYILLSVSSTLVILYFAIVVLYVGFAPFHTIAFAVIPRLSGTDKIGSTLGSFTAIGDIGRILMASAVPLLCVYIGWQNTALIFGVLAIIFGFTLIFRINQVDVTNVASGVKAIEHFTHYKSLLTSKNYLLMLLADGIDNIASAPLMVFLPFLLLDKGVSSEMLGVFSGAFFVGIVLGKILLGKTSDHFGEKIVFIVNELLMSVCVLAMFFTNNFVLLFVLSILNGAFIRGTVPVKKSMYAKLVDPSHYEASSTLSTITSGILTTITFVIYGAMAKSFDAGSVFILSAIFIVVSVIPFAYIKLSKHENSETAELTESTSPGETVGNV